jgi:FkbM family methyltransferase
MTTKALSDSQVPLAETLEGNRQRGRDLLNRFHLALRLRPGIIGSVLAKLFGPNDRRHIISAPNGLRVFADPFTYLGRDLFETRSFEPETEEILRAHLPVGGVFLDVGANEGYFSALAGTIVGPTGYVVSVEPQSRLQDIIQLNLMLNEVRQYRIYRNALGGEDGAEGRMNLWPGINTGASSLVRRYRFYRKTESIRFVSLERILSECSLDHIDLVKIDVEGFEGEVVRHMVPFLRTGRIHSLFIDYHKQILDKAGVDPREIHNKIMECGYAPSGGRAARLESYQLYQRSELNSV